MANRFYKAGSNQYQSQFVPTEMPLDMMAQGLNNKQGMYNNVQKSIIDSRAAFNERAYGTTHKEALGRIEGDFDEFVENSWDKDLTSPEFMREYQQFTADFRNNEELSTIRARQGNVDSLMAEKQKLQQEDKLNTARYHRVDKMLQQANSDQDIFGDTLSDAIIGEEADVRKGYEDIFNHIKASGRDSLGEINGIYFEKGWKGLSESKVGEVAQGALYQFMSTPAGRQEAMEYQMQVDQGLVDGESISANQFVFDRMMNVGREFAHGDSSFTGKAAAINTAATLAADKQVAQQGTIKGKFGTYSSNNKYNYDQMFGVESKSAGKFYEMQESSASIELAIQQLTAAQNYSLQDMGPMLENIQQIIAAAPGGNIILSGERELTSDEALKYQMYFQSKIDPFIVEQTQTDYWLSKQTVKAANALDATVGKEGRFSRSDIGNQSLTQAITAVLGPGATLEDRDQITEEELEGFLGQVYNSAIAGDIYAERPDIVTEGRDNTNMLRSTTTSDSPYGQQTATMWNNVEGYLDNILAQAKGKMTPQEYNQLVEDSETAKKYSRAFIAKTDVERAIQDGHDNPEESGFYEAYNSVQGDDIIQADADLLPTAAKYSTYDSSGRKTGSLDNPEYRLQNHIQQDPSKFTWTDDKGVEIDTSEFDFPGSTLTSTDRFNPALDDDHQTFTVSIDKNVIKVNRAALAQSNLQGKFEEENFDSNGDVLLETLDSDQKEAIKLVNSTQQTTITGRINEPGEDASYKQDVADREYNNYLLEPTTRKGQDSYVRYMNYVEPELSNDIQLITHLKVDEEYNVRRKIDIYKEGERILPEYVNFAVTKLPGENAAAGHFAIEVVDGQGNVIDKKLVYDDIGKVSSFITKYSDHQRMLIEQGYYIQGEVYEKTP